MPGREGQRTLDDELATVTLKAHFDGVRILLDEPFEIPPNSPLMVTVLPSYDVERVGDWQAAARVALSGAYGNDEPEYTTRDIKR